MREKVRAFMEQYHMVTAGERVLLGLSGGADSVCLFHLLRELQEPLGFSLLAVHVNHNLRGAEAGRDAAFAENLCREYDVPFYLYSCPVEKIEKEKQEIILIDNHDFVATDEIYNGKQRLDTYSSK